MPVTKVMQISALKCAPKAFGGRARTQWGSLQRPPDLGGFKSGGRDKGRRKGETTGGDRQLREGRGGRAGLRHVRGVRPNRAAKFRGAAISDLTKINLPV